MSILPLSAAQSGIFFQQQFDLSDPWRNLGQLTEIIGNLDTGLLETALQQTIGEAEAMQAQLLQRDGVWQQKLGQRIDFALRVIDVSSETDPSAAVNAYVKTAMTIAMNLEQWPLFDIVLFRAARARFFLFQRLHHVVFDGFSCLLYTQRLTDIYCALAEGREPPRCAWGGLADLLDGETAYRASAAFEQDRQFWLHVLADCPEPPTLATVSRPLLSCQSAVPTAHEDLTVDFVATLRETARRRGATLGELITAVMAIYVGRLAGEPEVVIGLPVTARIGRTARKTPGMMSNILPLRIAVAEHSTLTQVLQHVVGQNRRALRHQRYRIEDIRRDMGFVNPSQRILGPVVNIVPDFGRASAFADCDIASHRTFFGTPEDLSLIVHDGGGATGVEVVLDANPALYTPDEVQSHLRRFTRLLAAAQTSPDKPLSHLDILPPEERTLLLETWNDTTVPYPTDRCIHQLFEHQVQRTPEAVAVVFGDDQLTYAELNTRANQLAHHLIALGVVPGDYVVTLLERSTGLVIAQLAILKAGAAYVPLDPQAPAERHAWTVKDCAARLLVTDIPDTISDVPVLQLQGYDHEAMAAPNPVLSRASQDIAYVMYTSGSTGMPKGVLVPHQAVARLLINNGYARFDSSDRVAWLGNPAFDISTLEVWAPLLHGGTLVPVPYTTVLQPAQLDALLQQQQINVLHLTAGLFSQVADTLIDRLATLRLLLVGGDTVDPAVVARVLEHARPQHLLHCYGPTESTTFAATYEVTEPPPGSRLPIGRPIANTRLYLLDAHGQPVPLGAVGELYIGGAGVARGYLNRPELTAERFLDDPFSDVPDARMYRTGDLARYLPDGNLVFLGRNDHQVKIRGFRIECGEIEACLAQYPGVREAVVIAHDHASGERRLVAYVTGNPVESIELRTYLARSFPDYMVPAAFVSLDTLPLNPNGKLDRRALPVPDDAMLAHAGYEAPAGPIESLLAGIWRELLNLERVSRHDSFFALGGHSLLAVRLLNRLHAELGIGLPVSAVFETPDIRRLADRIGDHSNALAWGALIKLRERGSLPPLICIHHGYGIAWDYARLLPHLDPDIPVVAVQARGLRLSEALPSTMDEMIVDYVEQIQLFQPAGPYHLLGWSFGAVAAHAIATRLQQKGHEVAYLALLDGFPSQTEPNYCVDLNGRRNHLREHLNQFALRKAGTVSDRELDAVIDITVNNTRLACEYTPTVFQGDVSFFEATVKEHDGARQCPRLWSPYVSGNIHDHPIAARHSELLDEPHAALIGRAVTKAIMDL